MLTHQLPPSRCLACQYGLDAALTLGDTALPKPGDLTVCIGCALRLVFTDDLVVRAMTKDEFAALPPHLRDAMGSAQSLVLALARQRAAS